MTKQEAFKLLGVNGVGLANLLGIEPSAIYQWSEDQIPLAREYQIRDLANGNQPIKRNVETVQENS